MKRNRLVSSCLRYFSNTLSGSVDTLSGSVDTLLGTINTLLGSIDVNLGKCWYTFGKFHYTFGKLCARFPSCVAWARVLLLNYCACACACLARVSRRGWGTNDEEVGSCDRGMLMAFCYAVSWERLLNCKERWKMMYFLEKSPGNILWFPGKSVLLQPLSEIHPLAHKKEFFEGIYIDGDTLAASNDCCPKTAVIVTSFIPERSLGDVLNQSIHVLPFTGWT